MSKRVIVRIAVTLADGDEDEDVCNLLNKVIDAGVSDAADYNDDPDLSDPAAAVISRMTIDEPEVIAVAAPMGPDSDGGDPD